MAQPCAWPQGRITRHRLSAAGIEASLQPQLGMTRANSLPPAISAGEDVTAKLRPFTAARPAGAAGSAPLHRVASAGSVWQETYVFLDIRKAEAPNSLSPYWKYQDSFDC